MNDFIRTLLLFLVGTHFAWAQETDTQVVGFDPGVQRQCLNRDQRQSIQARLSENTRLLEKKGWIPEQIPMAAGITLLDWPLKGVDGMADYDFHGISNFVDQQAGYPDSLLDYACGERTYDLGDGYNHQGTDFFTWPFGWHKMVYDQVEVVAAAPGMIIGRSDGNFDRSCSFSSSSPWNAVYVRHDDGSVAWYGHLKKNSLTAKGIGARVVAGEYLGVVGSSGISTGPHLHFELYDAQGRLVDPFGGDCNALNSTSWWRAQRAYYDSGVNAVYTHSDLPRFISCPDTGETEQQNLRSAFQPGESFYLIAYYRDQLAGQPSEWRILQPDGNVWQSWSAASNVPHYAASYAWRRLRLPQQAMPGSWTWELAFEGETYTGTFSVIACGSAEDQQVIEIDETTATLSWTADPAALAYELQVKPQEGTSWQLYQIPQGTRFSLEDLNPATDYVWRMRSICRGGSTGPWTAETPFRTAQPACLQTIDTFPYVVGFEAGLDSWTQDTGESLDWTLQSGRTPSLGTGPESAAQGDRYLFVEASGTGSPFKAARLVSPCFDFSALPPEDRNIEFYYHMFGRNMGTLTLEGSQDGGKSWEKLWVLSGDQGESWQSLTFQLPEYQGAEVKFAFTGQTGASYRSDMALDGISVGLPVNACNAPADLAESSPSGTGIGLSWEQVPGAEAYELQIWDGEGVLIEQGLTAEPFFEFLTAVPAQPYTWQVRARCGNIWGPESEARTFTAPEDLAGLNDDPCSALRVEALEGCRYLEADLDKASPPSAMAQPTACGVPDFPDLWFQTSIPLTGELRIQTRQGTLRDAVMAAYAGETCESLDFLACNDDQPFSRMPELHIKGRPGLPVFVQVWGYNGARGTFEICLRQEGALTSGFDTSPSGGSSPLAAPSPLLLPNPLKAGQPLGLRFTLEQESPVLLQVQDLQGRVLLSRDWGILPKGAYREEIPLPNIARGIYWVKVSCEGIWYPRKLVVQP